MNKKVEIKRKEHVLRRQIYQEKRSKRVEGGIHKVLTKARRSRIFYLDLPAPEKFNLQYENCSEVIQYVNKLKRFGQQGKNLNIILKNVVDIGEGAIAMLLSVLDDLQRYSIYIKGTKPSHDVPRKVLEKSGFFNFVRGRVEDDGERTKNTILNIGYKDTSHSMLAFEIRKAMDTVWGINGRNPLVYSVALEMMRNSCDHAFKEEKNIKWHFAISHDELNKKVKFSFVDNGKGIIASFKNGFLKKVINAFKNNSDILDTAFKNGIESRTGLSWRGKGLPTIYENFAEKYIKNLLVITNDSFIHYDRGIMETLPNSFKGTYYYWEVDTSCEKACFE